MSEKSNPAKVTPEPRAIYEHANNFLATEAFLRRQVDVDADNQMIFNFPGIVLCAFSAELFLKCLIFLAGDKPKPTHNLLTLFDQLSLERQVLVERHWDEGSQIRKHLIDADEKRFSVVIPRDLKTALCDCGNAFQFIRYIYEYPNSLFYITHLPTSLRKAVEEVTGWHPLERRIQPTFQAP